MALKEVMKITHNQISIGNFYFHPFNKLKLDDVYVADVKGDTLLYVNRISAGFDLFKLWNHQLRINTINLENFVANVNKDSLDSDFNFQFLIDAFSSEEDDTVSTSSLFVRINDIKIKGGDIRYDIFSEEALSDSLFDFNHIHISDFNAHLDLNSIAPEKPDMAVDNLSLKEKSGFLLNEGKVRISSDEKKINLSNFRLIFPHSELTIPEAWIDYTGYEWEDMLQHAAYRIQLGENRIDAADFCMFYPDMTSFTDKLLITGEIEGRLPKIEIPVFRADYGQHVGLKLNASMEDFNHWQDTPLKVNLDYLRIDHDGMEEIMNFGSGETKQQLPVKINTINLHGRLQGKLPDLSLRLTAQTDRGNIDLNGTGGYEPKSGTARFDAILNSEHFDVETLLQDSMFGLADIQIQAKGNISDSGQMNIQAAANINRFDFNDYAYNQIQVQGSYKGDSIAFSINSTDKNLPIYLEGKVNSGNKNPGANLHLSAQSICIDSLHFLPDYKDVILSAVVNVDIAGLDPENMKADLFMDSLSFRTSQGVFNEPALKLTYHAADSSQKVLDIDSRLITCNAKGRFTYAGLMEAVKETFPVFFPNDKLNPKKKDIFPENLNFRMGINNLNSLTDLLYLPQTMPDSIFLMGRYEHDGTNMNLATGAYTRFTESDTIIAGVMLKNSDNKLGVNIHLDNKSSNYDFDGSIEAEVEFLSDASSSIPDMNITLKPTIWVLNETFFDFNPAQIEIRKDKYSIHDLSLSHTDNANEFVKINGIVSTSKEDSLSIDISRFQFGTIFGAMKADIPLSAEANGRISARNLLATPFIFTRNLAINNIVLSENDIGDLNIQSGWNSERNGIALRATLNHPEREQSVISGFALPGSDSLALNIKIRDIQMKWFQAFADDMLYGLAGSWGANIRVNGKMQKPNVSGTAYFNQAKIGLNMLNTLYTFNDSIHIQTDKVELKKFVVSDENRNRLIVDGKITHQNFANINPNLSIGFNNFLVMHNEHQTDSLFYGNLRVNGQLKFTKVNGDFLLSGTINHADNAKITINMPSFVGAAQRHHFVTYVDSEGKPINDSNDSLEIPSVTLPFRVNVALNINSNLRAGIVYNRVSGDVVEASGNGVIGFTYELGSSNMNLSGDFTLETGKATLSLLNLAKKTFTVKPGSKLVFRGDPLATTFNITALYTVRADATTLDPVFEDLLARPRIPVVISIAANGNMENMNLKYDIQIPNQSEEIQRRFAGLLYTDDFKIRQIAYLLATGSFMPPNSNNPGKTNLLSSVGSSALSSALNSALAGVLKDNWTIGTELKAGEDGFSDMDVDVNVSTQLFDNRLTINGTIGYSNDQGMSNNNLTGDFDAEYKLIPSGNIVLKAYNKTNSRYFETAPYTQGIGVVYKRNARTFRKLFDKLLWRKSKQLDNENVINE
ncbi:MAG: translocation/assembly module TamB [Dysgonamonadaceae bacterium]|jgi:hypothetical protein|nr:translocation/assembly module TamB [Dysgonamonadaceae bacterium]